MHEEIFERFPTAQSAPVRPGHPRREVLLRRAGIVVLVAVVVAACLGYLGPRSAATSTSTEAGTIEMEYDGITRPGVDSEIRVRVRPSAPTDGIVLAVDHAVLQDYGIDFFTPEPVEQRVVGDTVLLEFATAEQEEVEVVISGRTPTTQPPGRTPWRLRWLEDGATVAGLRASTWVVP